jgi:hypothetical protein
LEVFMRFVVLALVLSLLQPIQIQALPDPRPLSAGVQLDRKKVSPRTGDTHPWQPVSGLPKD